MGRVLYGPAESTTRIHSYLLRLNDANEHSFTDKELYFLIMGILGMTMIFVAYQLFRWLTGDNHVIRRAIERSSGSDEKDYHSGGNLQL